MNLAKPSPIKIDTLLLAGLIILGVYLRLVGIERAEGMWYDEINTYLIAKQPFPVEIVKRLLYQDLHMPLYYLMLHVWMTLFGDADVTLRLLSVIFGVLTLPASYLVGRELSGNRGGVATLCFFSINSGLIHFSQEVRFYSALVLFCTTAALFLIRLSKSSSVTNCFGLIASNVLIIYISTIGCVFVFVELTLFLIYLTYSKINRKHFWISCVGILFFSIPAILLLIYLTIKRSKLLFEYFDWYFFDFPALWTFLVNIGGPFPPRLGMESNMLVIWLVALSTIIFFFFAVKSIYRNPLLLTLFFIGIIPFLIEVVFAFMDKFAFSYWHCMFTVPFLIITAGYGFSHTQNRLLSASLAGIYLVINLSYIFFSSNSVLYLQKMDGYNLVAKEMAALNASGQDAMIMMSFGGNTAIKYDYKARVVPLSLDDYCFYSKEVFENILEPELINSLNKENVCSGLKSFAYSEQPTARYTDFIRQQSSTVPLDRYFFVVLLKFLGTDVYDQKHMIDVLRAKILYDTLSVMNHDKRFITDSETTSGAWTIFRFKRIS